MATARRTTRKPAKAEGSRKANQEPRVGGGEREGVDRANGLVDARSAGGRVID